MGDPLVSILIPCFNAAPWLKQALLSAQEQTWRRVEVIVVDDGSADDSFSVAQHDASTCCRIVRQEHRGASAARNRALELAQGEFIQYLDADDYLDPAKVQRQLGVSRENDCLTWSSIGHVQESPGSRHELRKTAAGDDKNPTDFLIRLWGGYGAPAMVAVHQWLSPRALLSRAGKWDENLSADDDGEFFARVILDAKHIVPVPDALCFYRKGHTRNNVSVSATRDGPHQASAMAAARTKAAHLLGQTCNEPARRAVARLITQQIVDTYPAPLHQVGLQFLQAHGLELSSDIEAPPWFQRARPVIGWKAARHLQNHARVCRDALLTAFSASRE